ncbi:MAG: hypothetical protein ACK58L_10215 [Planctomycetota bacterium]
MNSRTLVQNILLLTCLCCFSPAALAGTGRIPAPPEDPIETPPNCPEFLLGQIDGVYYYGTSNCVDTYGFGQSPLNIPVPQCLAEGDECGRPISLLNLLPQDEPTPDNLARWIQEVEKKKEELQRIVDSLPPTDGRRQRLQKLISFMQRTLTYLKNPGETLQMKALAKQQYDIHLTLHEHSLASIGIAGENPQRFSVRDVKIEGTPKSAADTNFVPSGQYPIGVEVVSTKGPVLKVEVAPGQFSYFQTFEISVKSDNAQRRIEMSVGVEITDEGLTSTTPLSARFSERGRYAHRLVAPGDRPFLVTGFTNLEPRVGPTP